MSPFWTLWTVVAAMVAVAVHLWLRGFARGDPGPAAAVPARILGGLVAALFGSLLLRVLDLVVLPCLLLAAAATAATGYAIWSACEPLQRGRFD